MMLKFHFFEPCLLNFSRINNNKWEHRVVILFDHSDNDDASRISNCIVVNIQQNCLNQTAIQTALPLKNSQKILIISDAIAYFLSLAAENFIPLILKTSYLAFNHSCWIGLSTFVGNLNIFWFPRKRLMQKLNVFKPCYTRSMTWMFISDRNLWNS